MIPIPKPAFVVKDVFASCVSKVKNKTLKNDLINCIQFVEDKSKEFEIKILNNEVYLFPKDDIVVDPIGKNEMINVYTNGMLKKGMPGRTIYDQIRSSAADDICPLCSVRYVASVDHYLPKTLYPVLAVTPINLIPSCATCNGDKKNRYPKTDFEQSLHPYFDNVNDENWIKASVLRTSPVSLDFYPDPPDHWDILLKKRAINHFNSYNLKEAFSTNANRRLRGSIKIFRDQFKLHPNMLKRYLWESYLSNLALGINSFEAILFFTLFKDDWFCLHGVNID